MRFASCCLPCALAYAAAISVSSAWGAVLPVTHFTFDSADVAGNLVLDTSGNGNHGTSYVQNTGSPNSGTRTATPPPLAAGVFGDALSLNGLDQYVAANGDTALAISSGFTVAAWFNRDVGENTAVITANNSFFLQDPPLMKGFVHTGGFFSSNGTAAPTSTWRHYAIVWDGDPDNNPFTTQGLITLYEDGVAQTPTVTGDTYTFFAADHSLYVGTWSQQATGGGQFTDGLIDEFFVFNQPLTAEQLGNLMTINMAEPPPAVPEPATWALLGLGLAALLPGSRRTSRRT